VQPNRLKELLDYDGKLGVVYRRHSGKALVPDYAGFVSVYDPVTKKTSKMKLKNIAAFLAFPELHAITPDTFPFKEEYPVIFHKNMQEDDFRANNLGSLRKENYKKLKEAYRNINESIKLTAHPTDQFSYVLHWYQNGAMRSKVIQDVVVAKREMLKLKLKYSKILTKYCVFD
jgi:hypothetical protein